MLNLYDSSPRPRKTQKLRAWIDAIVALGLLGLVVLALAFPRILPSALGLGGSRQADTVPTTRAWAYANPEPVARAWASGLEPSLVVACRSTLSQLRGPGFMKAALAPKLDARSRQPGADEAQDAISSLGSDDQSSAPACAGLTTRSLPARDMQRRSEDVRPRPACCLRCSVCSRSSPGSAAQPPHGCRRSRLLAVPSRRSRSGGRIARPRASSPSSQWPAQGLRARRLPPQQMRPSHPSFE